MLKKNQNRLAVSRKRHTFAADLCRAGQKKQVTGWPRPTVETRLIQINNVRNRRD